MISKILIAVALVLSIGCSSVDKLPFNAQADAAASSRILYEDSFIADAALKRYLGADYNLIQNDVAALDRIRSLFSSQPPEVALVAVANSYLLMAEAQSAYNSIKAVVIAKAELDGAAYPLQLVAFDREAQNLYTRLTNPTAEITTEEALQYLFRMGRVLATIL